MARIVRLLARILNVRLCRPLARHPPVVSAAEGFREVLRIAEGNHGEQLVPTRAEARQAVESRVRELEALLKGAGGCHRQRGGRASCDRYRSHPHIGQAQHDFVAILTS
jgi:hypothetical protein